MDKYQTLREKDNPSNNVYPNIKPQNIPADAITTGKIAPQAVTATKIALNSIQSYHLANGAVKESAIDALSVTTGKIADSAVTNSKIVDGAITTNKLGGGAISPLMQVEHWLIEEDINTIASFDTWIRTQLSFARKPFYDDGSGLTMIDNISCEGGGVSLKCSQPLQGISGTITLTTDSDFTTFKNSVAGDSLKFVGA